MRPYRTCAASADSPASASTSGQPTRKIAVLPEASSCEECLFLSAVGAYRERHREEFIYRERHREEFIFRERHPY
jgi:hypothetical protein